ncbi:MAG: zf-HC2 domain-containing protein [Armatimonadetes bacterium]|nr:zf-HC2 domain-containing protein [Armatimonadota bacterium]
MRCKEYEPLLSELIDEALPPRQVWEVERHLAVCNRCALVYNDLKRTVATLHSLGSSTPSPEFTEELAHQLQALGNRKAPLRELVGSYVRRVVLTRTVAAAVFVSLLGMAVFSTPRWLNQAAPLAPQRPPVPKYAAMDRSEFMALAVNDPLQDVSAISLESHTSTTNHSNRVPGVQH